MVILYEPRLLSYTRYVFAFTPAPAAPGARALFCLVGRPWTSLRCVCVACLAPPPLFGVWFRRVRCCLLFVWFVRGVCGVRVLSVHAWPGCFVRRGLCLHQVQIDALRASGDWKGVERAVKSFDVEQPCAPFPTVELRQAYMLTVRAEIALSTRKAPEAKTLALSALGAVPHFLVRVMKTIVS